MSRTLQTLFFGTTLATAALAATTPQTTVRPQARITAKVDAKSAVKLTGSISGKVAISKDLGRAPAGTQLSQMRLVLKSSDAQEAELNNLINAQQDRKSPNFHKWATPESFAAAFGIASDDIAKVTNWLADSGLTVNQVALGGRIITFSGPVSAMEAAFKTEMHSYRLDGETHIANATEISLPAALTSVVIGPARLNDFGFHRSAVFKKLVMGNDGQMHPVVPGTKDTPDYTSLSSGNHFVAPADFATIYNTKALVASGVDGTGVTIGVIGQTLIDPADPAIFRTLFGLPNNPVNILPGGDTPATIADDIEADLDVEWAGAVAPMATVIYQPEGIGALAGGAIDGSALNYINSNNVDIMTMSYGGCEANDGAASAAEWNTFWEQAAAQGQSVFVSTGDASATGCVSSSSANAGRNGTYGVNALGSSAYNVAVGGTMFNEGGYINGLKTGVTSYWGPGGISPYGTALSYIPESVMSDGAFNQVLGGAAALAQQNPGVFGGGGGVSMFTARPAWQVGTGITATDPTGPTFNVPGAIPAGQPHRLVPDVSIIGSLSHDDTIICYEGSCSTDPTTGLINGIGAVGGTSVATPVFASIMALIDQKNGGRQGNPNYYFYQLAAAETNLAACASVASPAPPASTCNFNDIVTGDNFSPKNNTGKYVAPVLDSTGTTIVTPGFIQGTLGTDYVGFAATTGYDEASGLGSPNVANLVNNWSTVTFNSTTTTLTLSPSPVNVVHGTPVSATVAVAAGSGVPTGDVAILATNINGSTNNTITLAAGTGTASLVNLPGGTYSIYAHYAGDGTYGASDSAPQTITITKEDSAAFVVSDYLSADGSQFGTISSAPYGNTIFLNAGVSGNSATAANPNNNAPNTGAPTGTLTFTVMNGSTTLPSFTGTLDASGLTYLLSGGTYAAFAITQNYPLLPAGPYTVSVSYPGDNSFNPTTASTTFTITKFTGNPSLRINTADVASGQPATVTVTAPSATGGNNATGNTVITGAPQTGTATLIDNTGTATLGTAPLVNGVAVITTSLLTTAGAHTVHAITSGDGNYNPGTSSNGTITVTTGTTPTVSVTSLPAASTVLQSVTLTASVPTGATGTVSFFDGSVYLGQGTISNTSHTATFTSTTYVAGLHNITATYSGNATVSSGTSAIYALNVAKNSPTVTLTSATSTNNGTSFALQSRFNASPATTSTTGIDNPPPSASMNFYDAGKLIGSAPIVYNSNAEDYDASFLVTTQPGPHTFTVQYPGDANYNPSDVVNTFAVAPSFSITVAPSALTIKQGTTGTATITSTVVGNYYGYANLTCSGLPQNTFCTFGQPALLMAGDNAGSQVTVSISTLAPTSAKMGGLLWLPAILLAGLLAFRRKQFSTRGRQLLALLLLLCGTMASTGCGNGKGISTPTGSYTVVISASGQGVTAASPNITPTATIALTIN